MSIWQKFPNLTRTELRTLAAVTCQELLTTEEGKNAFTAEFLEISPGTAATQIAELVGIDASDELREFLEVEDASRDVCLKILDEVRRTPLLAERVAAAYDAAQRTMSAEVLLLVGALVILAIKIKHIRWSESGTDVSFFESSDAIKKLISSLPFKF